MICIPPPMQEKLGKESGHRPTAFKAWLEGFVSVWSHQDSSRAYVFAWSERLNKQTNMMQVMNQSF